MIARVAVLAAPLLLAACDDSQVWHEPEPTLQRMQVQPRNAPFRGMRETPPLTVQRGPAPTRPPTTRALLERGRAQFEIQCASCHGIEGDGKSVVAEKMMQRSPPSLRDPRVLALTSQQLYDVITRGYGVMPEYASELDDRDRWAVVAYVPALQRSQAVAVSELPEWMRDELAKEAK